MAETENRPCISCNVNTNTPRSSYLLTMSFTDENEFVLDFISDKFNFDIEIDDDDRICDPCFIRAAKWSEWKKKECRRGAESDFEDSDDENYTPIQTKPQRIAIPGYFRAPNNKYNCIINNCTNNDLHKINTSIRAGILYKKNLYLSRAVRICGSHMESNVWPYIDKLIRHKYKRFNGIQVAGMCSLLKLGPKQK